MVFESPRGAPPTRALTLVRVEPCGRRASRRLSGLRTSVESATSVELNKDSGNKSRHAGSASNTGDRHHNSRSTSAPCVLATGS